MTRLVKCGICGKIMDSDIETSEGLTEHALYQHDGFFDIHKLEENKK